jgi:hypothetical protein
MVGTPPNCRRPPSPPRPPPPQCPMVRVCVQYGPGRPGSFNRPCIRYEMRRQCRSGDVR